jgi:hypothetical protein
MIFSHTEKNEAAAALWKHLMWVELSWWIVENVERSENGKGKEKKKSKKKHKCKV